MKYNSINMKTWKCKLQEGRQRDCITTECWERPKQDFSVFAFPISLHGLFVTLSLFSSPSFLLPWPSSCICFGSLPGSHSCLPFSLNIPFSFTFLPSQCVHTCVCIGLLPLLGLFISGFCSQSLLFLNKSYQICTSRNVRHKLYSIRTKLWELFLN